MIAHALQPAITIMSSVVFLIGVVPLIIWICRDTSSRQEGALLGLTFPASVGLTVCLAFLVPNLAKILPVLPPSLEFGALLLPFLAFAAMVAAVTFRRLASKPAHPLTPFVLLLVSGGCLGMYAGAALQIVLLR